MLFLSVARQVILVLLVAVAALAADENGSANVRCDETVMHVEVPATEDVTSVHLQGLREYPDRRCHAARVGDAFVLDLNLVDVFECGVTRMRNEKTGTVTYYHRVMIESSNEAIPMQAIIVSCEVSRRKAKRNVLPAGFQEPEELEIQSTLTGHGPKPVLGVNVRQGGIPLTGGQLHVAPGTPLQMEIYLDNTSAPIYGLLVAHMQVTDTGTQEETIIFNGCSVDPYLFDNFNTVDGDFLTAKFRAFKFPDSTYVQFRGTVSVCLDKCKGVECSNGVLGFGKRRKRAIASLPPDPNKIFEITITSFIKVNYEDDTVEQIALEKTFKHNGLITGGEEREAPAKQLGLARDEVQYTAVVEESANVSAANRYYLTYTCLVLLFTMFLYTH